MSRYVPPPVGVFPDGLGSPPTSETLSALQQRLGAFMAAVGEASERGDYEALLRDYARDVRELVSRPGALVPEESAPADDLERAAVIARGLGEAISAAQSEAAATESLNPCDKAAIEGAVAITLGMAAGPVGVGVAFVGATVHLVLECT